MTRSPVTGISILVFAIPLALLILASGPVGLLCDSPYAEETQFRDILFCAPFQCSFPRIL